jgi:hypothetical protein
MVNPKQYSIKTNDERYIQNHATSSETNRDTKQRETMIDCNTKINDDRLQH